MSGQRLTPDTAPAGYYSRRVLIPADTEWLAIVSGALLELQYAYNFEQFGTATPDETAARFAVMLGDFLNQGNNYMIGTIFAYANNTLPDYALLCDGSIHDKDDYPLLYDAISPDFHISASQFVLPDLRNRFIVGSGDDYAVGDSGGADSVTLDETQIPAHTHSEITAVTTAITIGAGAPAPSAIPGVGFTGTAGGGLPHENRPPFYALVWGIIAQ